MKRTLTALALLGASPALFAEGSPWLLEHGAKSVGLDVIGGSTDRFFIADESIDLGGDLNGSFQMFSASYGYDDIWAFDFRTGFGQASFETEFGASTDDESGIIDTSFGVTYQFLNEFEADNGLPTVSGRIGYTFGGNYDPNRIDALGDGASGFDISLLVGKSLTPQFSVSGDVTFRQRDDLVADSVKVLLTGSYLPPVNGLILRLSAGTIQTDSDIDIGDIGFGVEQFPLVDRDSNLLIGGANYAFNNGFNLGFAYSALLSGRNVADTDVASFSAGYTF